VTAIAEIHEEIRKVSEQLDGVERDLLKSKK
jgi:hypothetical protein